MDRILPGSVAHTVLIYSVSEPGEWTAADIVDDLDELSIAQVNDALTLLQEEGLLHENSTDHRLWPTRAGKDRFRKAV